jgi:biotin carboxyl carrier protein
MPGDVVRLACAEGARVTENQTVVILEALKMQMEIRTPKAGTVRYRVRPGEHVRAKAVLAEVS